MWWLVVLEGVREQCNRGAGCSLGTIWPDTWGWLFLESITVEECGKMTATAGGRSRRYRGVIWLAASSEELGERQIRGAE